MWSDKRTLGLQILGHYGYGGYPPGGFMESLLNTWGKADMMNQSRLADGFPELGEMIRQFQFMGAEEFKNWLDKIEV